jgi:hypothetical protein
MSDAWIDLDDGAVDRVACVAGTRLVDGLKQMGLQYPKTRIKPAAAAVP